MLEDLCQVPVIGIVPHLSDVSIPEEDSKRVALLTEERAVRENPTTTLLCTSVALDT